MFISAEIVGKNISLSAWATKTKYLLVCLFSALTVSITLLASLSLDTGSNCVMNCLLVVSQLCSGSPW